jgi:hypothetical protein
MDNGIAVRSMDSLPRAPTVPNMEFLKFTQKVLAKEPNNHGPEANAKVIF